MRNCARRNGRHVGICGQAPSDYPDVAAHLGELGIDAMSVTPDPLLKITRDVLAVEERLGRLPRRQLETQAHEVALWIDPAQHPREHLAKFTYASAPDGCRKHAHLGG